MAQLAVAWVLQDDNAATAIIGASPPEQVHDSPSEGRQLESDLLIKIDEVLNPVVQRDASRTVESSPKTGEA